MDYAELVCRTNYSFLKAASSPEEIIIKSKDLDYHSIAITDEATVSGSVRAHICAKSIGINLIHGSQFWVEDIKSKMFFKFIFLVKNKEGWRELCKLITKSRSETEKGYYYLNTQIIEHQNIKNCFVLIMLNKPIDTETLDYISNWLTQNFFSNCSIAISNCLVTESLKWQQTILELSEKKNIKVIATNDVLMGQKSMKPLLDVLTAIRFNMTIKECGYRITKNAEQYLKKKSLLGKIYQKTLLSNTLKIASQCTFSLDEIEYNYPTNTSPKKMNDAMWLRHLVKKGIKKRLRKNNEKIPFSIKKKICTELKIISKLKYEPYFLTAYDIVSFARSRNILCQGRGSAANSTVCFYLGITEVNPQTSNMLFARFISEERNEPPDIDIDFEHQRREEVIQYIYKKYGIEKAALAASVVTYKKKSAVSDVGKSLEIPSDLINKLSPDFYWDCEQNLTSRNIKEFIKKNYSSIKFFLTGSGSSNLLVKIFWWIKLSNQILGFPRHLSQHVGGFVISDKSLYDIVPIENARMENRRVIQWNKYDIEALNILKIDILGLGMLSAIKNSLNLLELKKKIYKDDMTIPTKLQDIPANDNYTYEMISNADTVGVFQIESRAQMAMLPKLKPCCFYDLVIEVAIVRPGPIKGGMVHPFLKRRRCKEKLFYPSKKIENILGRTLGVPIFQEQVMELAIEAADFTPGQADQLRRSLSTWKDDKKMEAFHKRIVLGMKKKGYTEKFAKSIFTQIQGFGEYGFPESHAVSFALLVYTSAWIKKHHPDVFLASMLNSQPLGFYHPNQLIKDAKDHGVTVLPVDVQKSSFLTNLECNNEIGENNSTLLSVRIGLNHIKNISKNKLEQIATNRKQKGYESITCLAKEVSLSKHDLITLAKSGALSSIKDNRYYASWEALGITNFSGVLEKSLVMENPLDEKILGRPDDKYLMMADFKCLGLSIDMHPMSFLRGKLKGEKIIDIKKSIGKKIFKTNGLITNRQKPHTAKGVVFMTIEDETGNLNLILSKKFFEANKNTVLSSVLVYVEGFWQKERNVQSNLFYSCNGNFLVSTIKDQTPLLKHNLGNNHCKSRDFQ